MGKFKVKKEYRTGPTSFSILMFVIVLIILVLVVAIGAYLLWCFLSPEKDRNRSDAIAIAKNNYGCDEVLVISHVTGHGSSRWYLGVLAVKGDDEIYFVMPSSPDESIYELEWPFNTPFRNIAGLALGHDLEVETESTSNGIAFYDSYGLMPKSYNGECLELVELIQNETLDVPFMIEFEYGQVYAVQVGGEVKIFSKSQNTILSAYPLKNS